MCVCACVCVCMHVCVCVARLNWRVVETASNHPFLVVETVPLTGSVEKGSIPTCPSTNLLKWFSMM